MPNFILAEGEKPFKNLSTLDLRNLIDQSDEITKSKFSELNDDALKDYSVQWEIYSRFVKAGLLKGGGEALSNSTRLSMIHSFQHLPRRVIIDLSILNALILRMRDFQVNPNYEPGLKFYYGYKLTSIPNVYYYTIIIVPVWSEKPDANDNRRHVFDKEISIHTFASFFALSTDKSDPSKLQTFDYNDIGYYKPFKPYPQNGDPYAAYYSYSKFYDFIQLRMAKIKDVLLEFGHLLDGTNKLSVVITPRDNQDRPIPIEQSFERIGPLKVIATSFDNGDLYPPSNRSEEIFY